MPPLPQIGARLYHREDIFTLRNGTGGGVVEINEPIGWDKIAITLAFDKTTNGFMFEFTDKDVTLEFDDAAGRQSLIDAYEADGVDANVYFGFGSVTDDIITLDFEMRLSFDTYSKNFKTVKMSAERNSFQDLIRTRFDVEVSLERTETLDGTALPELGKIKTWISPVRVQAKETMYFNPLFEGEDAVLTTVPGVGIGTDAHVSSVPPYHRPTQKQADDNNNCIDQVQSTTVEGFAEPLEPDGLIMTASPFTHGELNRKFSFLFKAALTVSWTALAPAVNPIYFHFVVSKIAAGAPLGTDPTILLREITNLGIATGDHPVLVNTPLGVILEDGELLFAKYEIHSYGIGNDTPLPTGLKLKYRLPDFWLMDVEENTNSAASTVNGYRLFEAINRQLEIITNKRNVLKSNFFGRTDIGYTDNGCGSHHVTFNGKMLRGACVSPQSAFTMSVKDNFNGLNALYCLGMSIERNDAGTEFVRLEPIEYFFKNVEIYNFEIISDYNSESANDKIFNELEFGFEKFPNDGQSGSLMEWLSKINYLTPIRTVKNKLSQVCGFILSTLYVQLTRDQSFLVKPAATYDTDKDNFLIGIRDDEASGSGGEEFGPYDFVANATDGTLTINNWFIPVVAGDEIYVTGVPGGNTTYKVKSVETQTPPLNATIIYTDVIVSTSWTGSIFFIDDPRFLPRLDEDFQLITGIPFPETKFNLEHTIKRIFYRWSKIFRSGLIQKTHGEKVIYTDGQLNPSVQLAAKPGGYTCDPPSAQYPAVRFFADSADELVSDLDKPLFKSDRVTFGAPMTWDLLNDWRKCFEARDPTRNYGYFRWKNLEGEDEKGYLESIKFDPVKNYGKFTFIQKPNV